MAVNSVEQRKNFASADTARGPSPNIWGDCPVAELMENPGLGHYFYDDFTRAPLLVTPTITTQAVYGNTYKAFGSTGATILPAQEATGGGLALLSDDDNEAVALQMIQLPYKLIITGGKFWFEARFKVSHITANFHGKFIGLGDSQTLAVGVPLVGNPPIFVTTQNYVGFRFTEATPTQCNTVYQADSVTPVNVKVDALPTALAADTYIKLGMKFDPVDRKLRFYVNNIELPDTKTVPSAAGTDFPNDVLMSPLVALFMGDATDQTLTLSWWRSAQIIL